MLLRDEVDVFLGQGRVHRRAKGHELSVKKGDKGDELSEGDKGDVFRVLSAEEADEVTCERRTRETRSVRNSGQVQADAWWRGMAAWRHGGMGDEQTSRSCCERSGRWPTTRRRVAGTWS